MDQRQKERLRPEKELVIKGFENSVQFKDGRYEVAMDVFANWDGAIE